MHIRRAAICAALALLLFPAYALAMVDPADIPMDNGEQQARACYVRAMSTWNSVMSTTPSDRNRLNASYANFATCAKVSIETGRLTPRGTRVPWRTEYFASTIGAMYAQTRLATITTGSAQCVHYSLARDLVEQALMTENEGGVPNPEWEDQMSLLLGALKQSAGSCGASISRR